MAYEALDCIGDPTRREILTLLRGGERSVRELTDELPVSQPAVSQHLKVLRGAGLVSSRTEGTRNLYRVDLDGLAGVRAWVDQFWDDALDSFVRYTEEKS
ncbi:MULTISPECIES: ArsR/SmtB family transcription factor [unclassified Nocardioides]|uniref:ArsR/SmtB family transcription factor n=1 Tax=unclassified Nocardioides TaxID=2615069 RepID=UPI0006FE33AA|nr:MULTISPECIES: metalloregulator ArsR/SmtB family transcription factor [unclassified Nocardioides]KQY57287.1 ArsR family transcriptional regulator [Nocardioides sp. Root140]KQZ68800.1 ArsR family transcriptional regulator [Nocardioides sp. Root151]KRF11930.1 ArsR family transcriptional regulator [Nocardioides sp. Soil796]